MKEEFLDENDLYFITGVLLIIAVLFFVGVSIGSHSGIQFSPCDDFLGNLSENNSNIEENNNSYDANVSDEEEDFNDSYAEENINISDDEEDNYSEIEKVYNKDDEELYIEEKIDAEEEILEVQDDKSPSLAPRNLAIFSLSGIGLWVAILIIVLCIAGCIYAGLNWNKWKKKKKKQAVKIGIFAIIVLIVFVLGVFLGGKAGIQFSPCIEDLNESVCGNGIIESGEVCDNSTRVCGGGFGVEKCLNDCAGYNSCIIAKVCGDGIIQEGEKCDGSNLNNENCITKGFVSGILSCSSECSFNLSLCNSEENNKEAGGANESNSSDSNLYIYYSFNDGNIAGIEGNAQFTAEGKNTGGFKFDGNGDSINLGNDNRVHGIREITVAAWVKTATRTTGPTRDIVGKGTADNSDTSFALYWNWNEKIGFRVKGSNGDSIVLSNNALNDREWHHVTGVQNSTNVKLYVDGVLQNDIKGSAGALSVSSIDLRIGGRGSGSWNGTIDEVRIYDRALSDAEIEAIY